MVAIDTNILVAAHRREIDYHKSAWKVLKSLAEGDETWGLPIYCIGEFLRVVTHPKVFDPPTLIADAVKVMEAICASPSLQILSPEAGYVRVFLRTCRDARIKGNLVFDAQITALLLESGVETLISEDKDFIRFSGLKTVSLADYENT